MIEPVCILMEQIEELCKRCYHLQKSNNDMYDYVNEDKQLHEYIDENEKIIEKYHRKINEIFQLINDHSHQETKVELSSIALDYKKMEEEEKRLFTKKKENLREIEKQHQQSVLNNDDGVYL